MLGGPSALKVAQDLWGTNCKLVLQIRFFEKNYRKYSVPLRASSDFLFFVLERGTQLSSRKDGTVRGIKPHF